MLDLMVDIETTGTDPVNSAVIQLAAVRFDYERSEIGSSFVASLDIPYGRYWDEGTREWLAAAPGRLRGDRE